MKIETLNVWAPLVIGTFFAFLSLIVAVGDFDGRQRALSWVIAVLSGLLIGVGITEAAKRKKAPASAGGQPKRGL
jgi:hypothetical protein